MRSRATDEDAGCRPTDACRQLDQRRRALIAKQDRAYDDFVAGRVSEAFWTRKSQEWDAELRMIEAERAWLAQPHPATSVTAGKF